MNNQFMQQVNKQRETTQSFISAHLNSVYKSNIKGDNF